MRVTLVAILTVLLILTACEPRQPATVRPQAEAVKQPDVMARKPILSSDVNVEDCWRTFLIGSGNPHMQEDDEFCTSYVESELILEPGANMEDWSPCIGESAIKLTHLGGPVYRFCMKVAGHDETHASDHANFQIIFSPVLSDGHQETLIIGIGGGRGSPVHGGIAHSEN